MTGLGFKIKGGGSLSMEYNSKDFSESLSTFDSDNAMDRLVLVTIDATACTPMSAGERTLLELIRCNLLEWTRFKSGLLDGVVTVADLPLP